MTWVARITADGLVFEGRATGPARKGDAVRKRASDAAVGDYLDFIERSRTAKQASRLDDAPERTCEPGTVRIALEELITRWQGRRADFEIVLSDDEGHLRAYQGILDGPYLGDDDGVGFMLGSRIIEGDIAVEGPLIDFSPADPDAKTAPILAENYVELRVVALPLVADVQGHEATWEALLVDQCTACCRLVTADPDGTGRE